MTLDGLLHVDRGVNGKRVLTAVHCLLLLRQSVAGFLKYMKQRECKSSGLNLSPVQALETLTLRWLFERATDLSDLQRAVCTEIKLLNLTVIIIQPYFFMISYKSLWRVKAHLEQGRGLGSGTMNSIIPVSVWTDSTASVSNLQVVNGTITPQTLMRVCRDLSKDDVL